MQDHLEVQLYRNKASMNFNELYLTHARTTLDGRYLWTSHDIDFDDGIQGVKMGEFLYPIMDLQKCRICHLHLMYATGIVLILSLFSVVIILFTQRSNYLFIILGRA